MMCTEFPRQRFLVPPAANCHCLESHPLCVLNSEMPQSSDTVYRYYVAGPSAGIAQRVVHGYTRAHERTRFFSWQFVGDRKSTRLNSSHVEISYAVFCLKK